MAIVKGVAKVLRVKLKPKTIVKTKTVTKTKTEVKTVTKVEVKEKRFCSVPDIVYKAKMMEAKRPKIYACAYRIYDVSRGMTGGPGGVLAMQKSQFGGHYRGYDVTYVFEEAGFKYPPTLMRLIRDYAPSVQKIFKAAFYITHNLKISDEVANGIEPIFVCHDIGSAYGAYLLGCKYVVIYHQQGGLINELEGFNNVLNEQEKYLINNVERIVFENASKVYFPSMGAGDAYRNTSEEGSTRSQYIDFADHALYNTIPDAPENIDYAEKLSKYELPNRDEEDMDVFLSIGDFNFNKGMERVPEVLKRYAEKTGRKVFWIAIGTRTEIYDKMLEESKDWNFKSLLIGARTDHDTVLSLIHYADYYIMLQRVSIFDLAILEAMRGGAAMILSKAGGNLEVNTENNIVFWEEGEADRTVDEIIARDKKAWGQQNADMFNKYFSQKSFFAKYAAMIDEEILKAGYYLDGGTSDINKENLTPWKNRFEGKKAIICGSGSSLDACDGSEEDAVYIALNRALFYDKVKFDMLFMQDLPQNQPYTIEDYNQYPCTKFYGNITNPRTQKIGFEVESYTDCKGEIISYELEPRWFDYKVDEITFDLEKDYILDMQSVLFSAIQFAIFAGFKEIELYGIEFSGANYGGNDNPNKYSYYVPFNMKKMKDTITEKYPDVVFKFGNTTNEELKAYFEESDMRKAV